MGRWEPNARGRLAEAALKLYAEQGFERTTVAEIAEAAGLTERTFFRHFTDKREVLFYGTDMARDLLTRTIAESPASASPMDAVGAALESFGAFFQEDPERVRQRHAIVSSSTELRERELVKLDVFASGMAATLRERGTPEPAASLAAEVGMAAFKVAYARWVAAGPAESGEADTAGDARPAGGTDEQDLLRLFRGSLAELREILADRAPA
ncbi:TetR/AcrR family transcriptional regulator [Streptomyces sp. TS71-3]|uniref:TetR/AcrR family transcriptional regulator n=1 Tax=Streptomyces sp. TS71-3 TaxID=2733862 RepID=UPI001BB3F8ED|nr:TetR/AcrR family transcriptional regulator [Streptomyces sp. TS71-3]